MDWAEGVYLEEKSYKQHHSEFGVNCNQIKADGARFAGGQRAKQTWTGEVLAQRQRCGWSTSAVAGAQE